MNEKKNEGAQEYECLKIVSDYLFLKEMNDNEKGLVKNAFQQFDIDSLVDNNYNICKKVTNKLKNFYYIEQILILIFFDIFIFPEEKTINELFSKNGKFYELVKIKDKIFKINETNNLKRIFYDCLINFQKLEVTNNYQIQDINDFKEDTYFRSLNDFILDSKIHELTSLIPLIYLLNYIKIKKLNNLLTLSEYNNYDTKGIKQYINYMKENMSKNPFFSLYEFIGLILLIKKTKESKVYKINNSQALDNYEYDISSFNVDMNHIQILIESIKFIPNIKTISFNENIFGEIGFFFLGQVLSVENTNTIKNLDLRLIFSDSETLKFFKIGFINNKNNIEKIDFSRNPKFNDAFCLNLSLLIDSFPNLKILNLSLNTLLGKKISYLFIQMKKLYKKGGCSIEELYLNKIEMSKPSLIALIDLLKSPFCLIKVLSMSKTRLNNFIGKKLFHALAINKRIEEIYLYNCNIQDFQVKDLLKYFHSFNLSIISFYKNKFHNIENIIKILSKTEIIELENEKFDNSNCVLNSLDLSNNICMNILKKDYEILIEKLQKSQLYIFDMLQTINENSNITQNNLQEIKVKLENAILQLLKNNKKILY